LFWSTFVHSMAVAQPVLRQVIKAKRGWRARLT
jgi:hypothetical protein